MSTHRISSRPGTTSMKRLISPVANTHGSKPLTWPKNSTTKTSTSGSKQFHEKSPEVEREAQSLKAGAQSTFPSSSTALGVCLQSSASFRSNAELSVSETAVVFIVFTTSSDPFYPFLASTRTAIASYASWRTHWPGSLPSWIWSRLQQLLSVAHQMTAFCVTMFWTVNNCSNLLNLHFDLKNIIIDLLKDS